MARVKVVGLFTTKLRVPPEGLTATVAPVALLVMVADSALVLAQVRFTELPGTTQKLSDVNWSMLNGSLTVTVTLVLTLPPGPEAVIVYVVSTVGDTIRLPLVTPLGSAAKV